MRALTFDQKIGYTVALLALALPILSVFVPEEFTLWAAAIIFSLAAIGAHTLIKKRSIHSYNKNTVLLIIAVIAALYLTVSYLFGLEYGFMLHENG